MIVPETARASLQFSMIEAVELSPQLPHPHPWVILTKEVEDTQLPRRPPGPKAPAGPIQVPKTDRKDRPIPICAQDLETVQLFLDV